MYALDGDIPYVESAAGPAAWNSPRGDLTFLDTEADRFSITDAKNGLIAYQPADAGDEPVFRVGARWPTAPSSPCGPPSSSPPTAAT